MIFHRLRLISFSKSLLSIKTSKEKINKEVENEDLPKVIDISTPEDKQDLQDNITEFRNASKSNNFVNTIPGKPHIDSKSRSESIRIFQKKLAKCTKKKPCISVSDLRRRLSLKSNLNSNKIKKKLNLNKKEKSDKKKYSISKKYDVNVLYTSAGPWFRSHSSTHLRTRGMHQAQSQLCFYRNKRLINPYTYYQNYSRNHNPFQKVQQRSARRKIFCEASRNCPCIHHPLKLVTSSKIKQPRCDARCFRTNPLHYNLLRFPQSSKTKMANNNELRLYRSEGMTTDSVRYYAIDQGKPCLTGKVSRGKIVSTFSMTDPVKCVDIAVSTGDNIRLVASLKSCKAHTSSKSSNGRWNSKQSAHKFSIDMFYSEALQNIAGFCSDHSKQRSTLKNVVKYSLLSLVTIAWTPCMLCVMVCYLITYPFKFQHDMSCYNKKKLKCSKDFYHNQWLSNFINFARQTPKAAKHAIFNTLRLQSSEPKDLPDVCSYPNPKRKYTLFYADGRGWVIKPSNSGNPKQKKVFNNTLYDNNRSNACKTCNIRDKKHLETCTSSSAPCKSMRADNQHYKHESGNSWTASKTSTPPRKIPTLSTKTVCKFYHKCVTAATTKTLLRNFVNTKTVNTNLKDKVSWVPSTPKTTSRHQYVRPCKPCVCRPKKYCVFSYKSTVEKCCIKSFAGKLLHYISMSLLKKNQGKSSHGEPTTKEVCSGLQHVKRSRSSNGVRRSDPEWVLCSRRSRSASEKKDDGFDKRQHRKRSAHINECDFVTCQPGRFTVQNMSPYTCQPEDTINIGKKCGPLTCRPKRITAEKCGYCQHERKSTNKCGPPSCQCCDPYSKRPEGKIKCGPPVVCQQKYCKNINISNSPSVSKKNVSQAKMSPKNSIMKSEQNGTKEGPHSTNTGLVRSPSISKKDDTLAKVNSNDSLKKLELKAIKTSPQISNASPIRSPPVSNKDDTLAMGSLKKLETHVSNKPRRVATLPFVKNKPQDTSHVHSPSPVKGIRSVNKKPRKDKYNTGSLPITKRKAKQNVERTKPKVMSAWLRKLRPKAARTWRIFTEKTYKVFCTNNCSDLYIHTLRARPWFWVYRLCPKMYPHFLRCYYSSKTGCNICMTCIAVCLWAPIICCCYLSFQLVSCFCS